MGRGFGRGARSVAVVTNAQVKGAAKKMPKGLRSGRRQKRDRMRRRHDDQAKLEESLGMAQSQGKDRSEAPSLMQEIASIQIPHIVNKRHKGFGGLRRQIIQAVKDVRRRHSQRAKRQRRPRRE